jgi:uncharacterized membrane protein YphA (DoxX/SURF4 family)
MTPNPFLDAWHFLTGNTNDYNALGAWKYLLVALYWGLLIASVAIAARVWRDEPARRTGSNLAIWVMRVLIGTMWFEGMLWKLPMFSESNGLHYWMEQMGQRAAFAWHRDLVANVYLPYFDFFNILIFLAELGFAAGLMLGIWVRLISVAAIPFCLHLWLGIYRAGEPAEWAWSYIFLVIVHAGFAIHAAGRSLGLDALLRQRFSDQAASAGLARLLRAAS